MTIKYVLTKFIEFIIKSLIVICFVLSTLTSLFFFVQASSIDYQKVISCLDLGIYGWDYEKRVCRLGLKIDD
jgi:hypothetical protein